MINKETVLNEAKKHLTDVIKAAEFELGNVEKTIARLQLRINNFASPDEKVEAMILANNKERHKQLHQLIGSPYFMRCDVNFGEEQRELYFGKFQIVEANVYSWVSPIARLRFMPLGQASYMLPRGEARKGEIRRKDQFLIVDGKIMFMASESSEYARILIHQEHLAIKKSEFVLPEIIARMEQAQDEVIRADHHGSFLISGPAGSGKTTLAFHRIAYLTQSPDTAKMFPGYNIIVFVQDEATKKYFGDILPQLGIEEVTVTTFEEWSLQVLGLQDYSFVQRFGQSESEKDKFEYYKNKVLKDFAFTEVSSKNSADLLRKIYVNSLPQEFLTIFERQLKSKVLDRFDLTLLLQNISKDGSVEVRKRVVTEDKNGKLKMAVKTVSLSYSFIVVDEAENYLVEQIQLFKSMINENKTVLYVGDLAQQTKLGTIRNWEEVQEKFSEHNKVILDKVYRNTKEILNYVKQQGYDVSVPMGLKDGAKVVETTLQMKNLASEISKVIKKNSNVTIGILYDAELAEIVQQLNMRFGEQVKFLTFNEAQGVEFEVVVLCRFSNYNTEMTAYPEELRKEKEKIKRDLWYVALTRSMNQLIVLDIT